jgi:hypothetical protein
VAIDEKKINMVHETAYLTAHSELRDILREVVEGLFSAKPITPVRHLCDFFLAMRDAVNAGGSSRLMNNAR